MTGELMAKEDFGIFDLKPCSEKNGLFFFKCDCGKTHRHGNIEGWRAPHCSDKNGRMTKIREYYVFKKESNEKQKIKKILFIMAKKIFPKINKWTTRTMEWEDGDYSMEIFHSDIIHNKRIILSYKKGSNKIKVGSSKISLEPIINYELLINLKKR